MCLFSIAPRPVHSGLSAVPFCEIKALNLLFLARCTRPPETELGPRHASYQ